MKPASILLLLTAGPLCAQMTSTAAAPVVNGVPCVAAAGPKIAPQQLVPLETSFADVLNSVNRQDRIDILGSPRALYLSDYGVTLTSEVSLVVTPGPNPFRTAGFTKTDKERMNKRKAAQLPLLKKAMRDYMNTAALMVTGAAKLPPSEIQSSRLQVVIAVRLLYLEWEDTTGLPAQILMKASLGDAVAGKIHEEVQ